MAAQHGVFPRPAAHAEGYAKLTGTPGVPIEDSIRWKLVLTLPICCTVGTSLLE